MKPRQRKEATSIAGRAINWLTDKLGVTEAPTYTDGYGVERRSEVPFNESAQGQELKRMGTTALNVGNLGLIVLGAVNPTSLPSFIQPIAKTLETISSRLSPGYYAYKAGKPTLGAILNAGEAAVETSATIKSIESNIREKNYADAIKETGLSLAMLPGTIMTARLLNPRYRAEHAYNTIDPRSYKKPMERGKRFLSSMLESKTYKTPNRDTNPEWAGSFIPLEVENRQAIGRKGREDAFRIYLGLTPENNYYIKNADGTYSYNLAKINQDSNGTFKPILSAKPNESLNNVDYITGAHGGLHSNNIHINNDGSGIQTITDVYDLNPFSRKEDLLGNQLSQTLNNKIQNFRRKLFDKGILGRYYPGSKIVSNLENKTLNRFRSREHFSWLNNAAKKLEMGFLLGGKPFTMKTQIPFDKTIQLPFISRNGINDYEVLSRNGFVERYRYQKPWRSDPNKTNITVAYTNYGSNKPNQYFELVKDIEPNYYSVHFKTDRGALDEHDKWSLIRGIVDDLPQGAKLSTWGTVSKGGFSGLNRFQTQGKLVPINEYRIVGLKDPSIATFLQDKYGYKLNADNTVNIPILQKQ